MQHRTDGSDFRSSGQVIDQDWDGLATYLSDQGMQLDTATIRQFSGGFANLNYLVRVDDTDAVLRRPPPGPLPPGAYDMARESKILSRLHEQFPLAPKSLHLCEDTNILGAPFQITEYRPSVSIRAELPERHTGDPQICARLGKTLIATLASLHNVDPDQAGLGDLGRPAGFLNRAVRGWSKRARLAAEQWASATTPA